MESPSCIGVEVFVAIDEQIAVGLVSVTTDPTAQLMKLGQAIAIGFIDEHRIGIRDVQTAFDDRGRQKDIGSMLDEVEHDLFESMLGHLTMSDHDAGFGCNPL